MGFAHCCFVFPSCRHVTLKRSCREEAAARVVDDPKTEIRKCKLMDLDIDDIVCYVTRFVRAKSWGSLGGDGFGLNPTELSRPNSRNTTSPQTRILLETYSTHPSFTPIKSTSEADPNKQKPLKLRYFHLHHVDDERSSK